MKYSESAEPNAYQDPSKFTNSDDTAQEPYNPATGPNDENNPATPEEEELNKEWDTKMTDFTPTDLISFEVHARSKEVIPYFEVYL